MATSFSHLENLKDVASDSVVSLIGRVKKGVILLAVGTAAFVVVITVFVVEAITGGGGTVYLAWWGGLVVFWAWLWYRCYADICDSLEVIGGACVERLDNIMEIQRNIGRMIAESDNEEGPPWRSS